MSVIADYHEFGHLSCLVKVIIGHRTQIVRHQFAILQQLAILVPHIHSLGVLVAELQVFCFVVLGCLLLLNVSFLLVFVEDLVLVAVKEFIGPLVFDLFRDLLEEVVLRFDPRILNDHLVFNFGLLLSFLLFRNVFFLDYLFQAPFFLLAVSSPGSMSAPSTLYHDCHMFKLLVLYIIHVLRVQPRYKVILSSHRLESSLNLGPFFKHSLVLTLELFKLDILLIPEGGPLQVLNIHIH